jgi:MFS family permease
MERGVATAPGFGSKAPKRSALCSRRRLRPVSRCQRHGADRPRTAQGIGAALLEWIVSPYVVAFAGLVLGGRLADRFGRQLLLVGGLLRQVRTYALR